MHNRNWVLFLGLMVGCGETVGPVSTKTTVPDQIPHVTELLAATGPAQEGWIWSFHGEPIKVEYFNWNGLGVWQGDLVLGPVTEIPRTEDELVSGGPKTAPARGISTDGPLWSNAVIPYVIDPSLPTPSRVTDAIAHIEDRLPFVSFVPRSSETSYVQVLPIGSGCGATHLGSPGSNAVVTVYLSLGCSTGNAIHELGHVLGLAHEHSRCDRDTYVTVHWDNILPGYDDQFSKLCTGYTDIHGYNEGSIMHYGEDAFAFTGTKSLTSKYGHPIGQRDSLSQTDAATLQEMYPLPVQASGPQVLFGQPQQFQWTAAASGSPPFSVAPYSYVWEVNYPDQFGLFNPSNWQGVGGGATLNMYVSNCDGSFMLRAKGYDANWHRGTSQELFIENWISGGGVCP